MLKNAYAALKPGGYFALDVPNAWGVRRRFQKRMLLRRNTPAGTVTVERHSQWRQGFMAQEWVYALPDGQCIRKNASLRYYSASELFSLLRAVGFSEIKFWGSVNEEALRFSSPRCIAVAQRPASS
jgi:hypothetical protein